VSRVVILAGEGEYDSAKTMSAVAADLRAAFAADVTYLVPDVLDDAPHFPASTFGGLAVLEATDLLVV
jgi:hypothetical protein